MNYYSSMVINRRWIFSVDRTQMTQVLRKAPQTPLRGALGNAHTRTRLVETHGSASPRRRGGGTCDSFIIVAAQRAASPSLNLGRLGHMGQLGHLGLFVAPKSRRDGILLTAGFSLRTRPDAEPYSKSRRDVVLTAAGFSLRHRGGDPSPIRGEDPPTPIRGASSNAYYCAPASLTGVPICVITSLRTDPICEGRGGGFTREQSSAENPFRVAEGKAPQPPSGGASSNAITCFATQNPLEGGWGVSCPATQNPSEGGWGGL